MSDENLAKAPGKLLHIPTVAGAVVVTYNLPGEPKLKLDGETIVDIFRGKITKWNDARIAGQNPGVELPAADIVVVHRSDGSGTTYIFTDYLSTVSDPWREEVGKTPPSNGPSGSAARAMKASRARSNKRPEHRLCRVDLRAAKQTPLCGCEECGGKYISASLDSVTAAMATAKVPDDFRFSMVNAPGADAYPIAGATWLLVYETQKDPAKGKKMVEFLNWALTEGEQMAASLDYAPCPRTSGNAPWPGSKRSSSKRRTRLTSCCWVGEEEHRTRSSSPKGLEELTKQRDMAETLITVPASPCRDVRLAPPSKVGDRLFKWLTMIMGLSVGALIVLVGFTLWRGAAPSVHHFGPGS
jgi:phosphate transport system substrate-binding protein